MIPHATLHPNELSFHATVTTVAENGAVTLSETHFYPTGGGQPHDTGILTRTGEAFRVTDVRKGEHGIIHTVDRTGLAVGDEVEGSIDAERRQRHRRMHTGVHIVCALLERDAGTRITGNQIGEEKSRLDVDLQTYDPAFIEHVVAEANAIIAQDLHVSRRVVSRAEFLADPSLVKLAVGFPEHVQDIHLVEIPGIDKQACGGTHVDHLGEIGKIVFLKSENRGKNNRRIYLGLE